MDDGPRPLLTTAEVVRRITVERTTVKRWARAGRIPGATKLEGVWRFDPDAIEGWIAAGQPPSQVMASRGTSVAVPALATQRPERHQAGGVFDAPSSPRLVPLFPTAAHRGITDAPATGPATTARLKRRARR
jgi:hypothetical protein